MRKTESILNRKICYTGRRAKQQVQANDVQKFGWIYVFVLAFEKQTEIGANWILDGNKKLSEQ